MNFAKLKSFFELLPYRLDQALVGPTIRQFRVSRRRGMATTQVTSLTRQKKRLYVDLAVISRHDAGTGIQRVVRALALALIEEAAGEWDVCFVAANRRKGYHTISWPVPTSPVQSSEMKAFPGDVFLGLDFSLDSIRRHRQQLARFRRDGGRLWFLICDLLPVERPEWFSPNNVLRYKAWLEIISGIADGFLCISGQTEGDLRQALRSRYSLIDGYRACVIPMGYAISDSMLQEVSGGTSACSLRFDTSSPFSLMVGTLEPRKGHADVLAGFSELWRQGAPNRLVLVGRIGWHTEELRDAIRSHPELGRKLVWLDDVEDPELERIYQACEGVIIASHAEGFGLPLVEALGHNKPVLARDLPIFRCHEKLGVQFFPANADPQTLAICISKWCQAVQNGTVMVTPPTASWRESARTLLSALAN